MSKYKLATTCVQLSHRDVDDLREMTDKARSITFETFARHCDWKPVARDLGYAVGPSRDLHMKKDWMVHFYRSTFKGEPCYYFDHSRIEHIFLKEKRHDR